ncbi:Uncharacterised protein [Mycobacteroides abscessus subsp. abscessus]|nr:Uncharacterised protein [Mycobacteroides abscessus subsp. abscessus]
MRIALAPMKNPVNSEYDAAPCIRGAVLSMFIAGTFGTAANRACAVVCGGPNGFPPVSAAK